MLYQLDKITKQIQRSLDRLDHFTAQQDMNLSIPAFYYSADLLYKYAYDKGSQNVNCNYFTSFKSQLQRFDSKGNKQIKKVNKQILQEIFQIVNSQLFTNCTRPDILSINKQKHQSSILSQQCLLKVKNSQFIEWKQQQAPFNEVKQKKILSYKQQLVSVMQPLKAEVLLNQQFLKQWTIIQNKYKDHNIDQTYRLLQNTMKLYPYKILPQDKKSFIDTVKLQYDTMKQFYAFYDIKGWIFDKEENGVKLQYILFEQQKQIAIRIEGIFQGKIQNFLAIISEVNLMGDYVPFCYDARLVKQISRNERIGTSKVYIPCLTDRQIYFYAVGYDRMQQTNSMFFYSKTVNQDVFHQKKYGYSVPKQNKYVRLDYKFFLIEYIPITNNKARIRIASSVDLKLNFLPSFILSLTTRKFAFNYFSNIIKINKKFGGSAWEIAIKQKPDLYNFFKKKIQEYFSQEKK